MIMHKTNNKKDYRRYLQFIGYLYSKVLKKIRGSSVINSSIHSTSKIESGSNIVNVFMDKYSFCGYDCDISNCKIGSYCSIANNVIIGGGMHPMNWVAMSPVFYYGRDSVKKKFSTFQREHVKTTIIGHDVWLGHGVHIKQGVTIGTGAVVGMGAVVTKDVPPYAIVGGNPAKIIRMRFNENVVKDLLKSEWWLLPDFKMQEMAQYIKNPEEFLGKL